MIKLDDIKFNGKSSGICPANQGCMAVVDSGSTGISFPSKMIKALSDGGVPFKKYSKKCKKSFEYGTMEFIIGGNSYPLRHNEWMMRAKKLEWT